MTGDLAGTRLTGNTLRVTAWNGVRLLLQLGWLVLLVRRLGPEEYGQFVGIASLGIAAGGFASLGMGLRMYRDTAAGRAGLGQGWALMLGVMTWSSLLLFLGASALALVLLGPSDLVVLAALLFAEVVIAPIVTQVAFAHASVGEMGRAAAVPSLLAGARLLGLLLVPNAYGLRDISFVHLVATLASAVLVLLLAKARLDIDWRPVAARWREIREGLSFSALWASGLAVGSLDKLLTLKWGGDVAAGHYAVGQRIAAIIGTPVESLAAAVLPQLFKSGAGRAARLAGLGKMVSAVMAYGLAAGVVVWVCAPLVQWLLGEGFAEVGALGPWMAGYVLLYCLRMLGGTVLLGWGLVGWRLGSEVVSLAVFAILALAWAPQEGAAGAMAALLVMEACMGAAFWGRVLAALRESRHGA